MNSDHVSFEQLSDLIDDALPSRKERETILKHLSQCPECETEFRSLSRTLSFCRQISLCGMKGGDLCSCIQERLHSRNRRRALNRYLPAIAASFLIISGVALFNATGMRIGEGPIASRETISEAAPLAMSLAPGFTDAEKVIAVVRRNHASISSVSDFYVEGRVPAARFSALRRDLGNRRVAYAVVGEPQQRYRETIMNGAIAPVGIGPAMGLVYHRPAHETTDDGHYVVFRVFR